MKIKTNDKILKLVNKVLILLINNKIMLVLTKIYKKLKMVIIVMKFPKKILNNK